MILIDQPYVSDFLIQTIKNNNMEIVATKVAQDMIPDKNLNWVSEKDAAHQLQQTENPLLYTSSENALSWIFEHLKNTNLPQRIKLFKDKLAFRQLIHDLYPDFLFKEVRLEAIKDLDLASLKLPFVIKPSLGFFSIGVHIVRNKKDWETAQKELNYDNLKSIYPKEVMDASTFIIEDYIEGEEFAIDTYFNQEGEAVVLNILHHRFSSSTDVSDRVYSTSPKIIAKNKAIVERFLNAIGKKTGLKNFPLHLEVRIDKNGNLKPIEINPQRFGGWCTTGDLAWHAYNINVYKYFLENKKPDWDTILKNDKDKIYSIILLTNESGIPAEQITSFDYEQLSNDFEKVLEVRKVDYKKYPAFGFLFTETSLTMNKNSTIF